MSYINRPYGSSYCEAEREVIHEGPYGIHSEEYRVEEYGNRVHPHNRHSNNGVVGVIGEIVSNVISGGHHNHRPHSRPTEIIERREEHIVDNCYDPYRRIY